MSTHGTRLLAAAAALLVIAQAITFQGRIDTVSSQPAFALTGYTGTSNQQPENDKAGNVDLPRFPSISPDGSQVVFSWRGDLWKVAIDGGRALRLTNHPANETRSAWSADGSRIAFNSDRTGYTNIHMMNADGTDVSQITDVDRGLTLQAFGVDEEGNEIVSMASYLEGDVYRDGRPYMVRTTGGDIQRLHDAFGRSPVVSPNGQYVAFTRGGSSWDRRHYMGPDDRDVWVFDRQTGEFRQLTAWEGNDGLARWASDDSLLYLSDRELDCVNLYSMPFADGDRSARRLTSFNVDDVQDFDVSADGKAVVFMVWDTLYALDLSQPNAEPRALVITAAEDERDNFELRSMASEVSEAALSPDGKVMAYVAYGEVYVRNLEDKSPTRRVTETHARERDLAWSPDGLKLYFVSDRDGSESIYAARVTLTRSEIKESFEKTVHPEKAKEKAAGAEDESAEQKAGPDEPDQPTVKPAGGEKPEAPGAVDDGISGTWQGTASMGEQGELPFTLTLSLAADNSVAGRLDSEHYSGSISGTWSPAAKQLALVLTLDDGTIVNITLTVENGSATGSATGPDDIIPITATRTSGPEIDKADEAEATGNDDEKKKEEEEELPKELQPDRWHDAVRFEIEPVVADTGYNDRNPNPSPDGRHLLFRRTRGDLVLLNLETGEMRTVIESWDTDTAARWSPDSKYLAYQTSDLDFNSDIWIVPADLSTPAVNITRHPDNDSSPRWSLDGKILSFISERVNEEFDVWMVYLDRDLEALIPKELEEYYDEQSKAAKKRTPLKIEPPNKKEEDEKTNEENAAAADEAKADDDDEAADDAGASKEEKEVEADELELDDAYLRLRRVTRLQGSEGNLEMTPAGDYYIFSSSSDSPGLYSVKWDGSDQTRLAGYVNVQHMSLTGDKVVFVSGGRAGTVSPTGGKTDYYTIDDTIRIDLQKQASQKFMEAARVLGENFYHPNMKGLDWDALSKKYHELAVQSRTADEFEHIASRFIGELNASHLGVYARGDYDAQSQANGRLGTIHHRVTISVPASDADNAVAEPDAENDGASEGANEGGSNEGAMKSIDGYEITEIIPQSPAALGSMALEVGDVITAIELEPFGPTDTVETKLKGRINQETIITIRRKLKPDDASPTELNVLLTPISFNAESDLKYEWWRNENARKVAEWSDGRVGYIHIEGMNQPSLDVFERDLYAAAGDEDGLIIDVRNNGGGWTTDRLLSSIMVRPHAYTLPRGADRSKVGHYPQDRLFIQRYTLPINMLCNEKSFSNAEIVSHAFKTLGRGTLVGQETYGGVISTGGFGLIDGTFVRLPFRGWFLVNGEDMENNGAMPDILVPQTPEAESRNDDEQLRAAVDDLLKRLP